VAGEGRRLATVQWRPGMGRPTLRLILASLVLAQMEEVTGAVRHLAGQSPRRRGLLLGRSVPFGLAPVLKPIGRGSAASSGSRSLTTLCHSPHDRITAGAICNGPEIS